MCPLVVDELFHPATRGDEAEDIAVAPEEIRPVATAQLIGVVDHDIENGLQVER